MKYTVVCVWVLCWLLEAQSDLVFDSGRITATEENEVCRREGGRQWLCKKVADCASAKKLLQGGGKLQTCSWKNARTHIVCCPPTSGRQPITESISLKKCKEYQQLLCKNGVYQPPTNKAGKVPAGETFFHIEVFGGTNSKPASHPYMALIGFGKESSISWQCGGSLVSENFVLSAAHCSDTSYGPASWVRLGDLDLSSNTEDARPQQFQIVERVAHSGYSAPAYYNDVVLFRLDRKAVFDKYVGPACLYPSVKELEGSGVATGWGKNESNGPRISALQEVTLKFVPTEMCKTSIGRIEKLLPRGFDGQTMFCAGQPGKDTCQGDSGGPLVMEEKGSSCLATQAGVTSFGPRFCGETRIPGAYVRVAYFLPWIESVVWPKS